MEYSKEIQKEIPKFDYNDFSYDLRNGEYNTAIGKMRGYIENVLRLMTIARKSRIRLKTLFTTLLLC